MIFAANRSVRPTSSKGFCLYQNESLQPLGPQHRLVFLVFDVLPKPTMCSIASPNSTQFTVQISLMLNAVECVKCHQRPKGETSILPEVMSPSVGDSCSSTLTPGRGKPRAHFNADDGEDSVSMKKGARRPKSDCD